jgi:site-specific recombinase XerD
MTKPLRLPSCLTPQEYVALTSWTPTSPLDVRNLCMIRLMVNTGLRSKEILGIRLEDLNFADGKLLVAKAKGGRQRIVWLNEEDLGLVQTWISYRNDIVNNGNDHGVLFVARSGQPMSSRNLRKMVKATAFCVGILKDVHPHMLRHTFATDLLRNTKNLRLTQKALGHASIQTTTVYTHIVDEELEKAMKGLRISKS